MELPKAHAAVISASVRGSIPGLTGTDVAAVAGASLSGTGVSEGLAAGEVVPWAGGMSHSVPEPD